MDGPRYDMAFAGSVRRRLKGITLQQVRRFSAGSQAYLVMGSLPVSTNYRTLSGHHALLVEHQQMSAYFERLFFVRFVDFFGDHRSP
jgi:hypothetical protein